MNWLGGGFGGAASHGLAGSPGGRRRWGGGGEQRIGGLNEWVGRLGGRVVVSRLPPVTGWRGAFGGGVAGSRWGRGGWGWEGMAGGFGVLREVQS